MPGLRTTMVAAAGAALLAAGCGGATSTTNTSGGGGSSSAAGTPMTISAVEYQFTPNALTVAPGATVSLSFTNNGTTTHNVTASDLKVNQDAAPGATQVITFTAPQSGSFPFHCEYHPTKMTGTITVGGSPAASASPASSTTTSSSGYGGAYP